MEEEIRSFENFKVELEDGSVVEPQLAVLGYYYTENELLNTILPSIELPNSISIKYTNKHKEKWIEFFEKLGVICLKSEEDIINYKIRYLLKEQDTVHTTDNTVGITHQLVALHQAEKLTKSHYDSLRELNLLLKYSENTFLPAAECHLSSEYKPKLDLDNLLNDDERPMIFVSEKYESKSLNLSSFFKKIGVGSDFNILKFENQSRTKIFENYQDYFEYLDKNNFYAKKYESYSKQHGLYEYKEIKYSEHLYHFEISLIFWKTFIPSNLSLFDKVEYWVMNKSTKYSVPSPFEFFLKNNKTLPARNKEVFKPFELFSYRYYNIIENDSLVPCVDLSHIKLSNAQNLEEWLGVRQRLSLEICFKRILKILDFEKLQDEGIWGRIQEIFKVELKDITQNDKIALENFKENGSLPNQLVEWKPVNELYYISDGFELGVGNSQWLIIDDLNNISSHIGITSLIESDFKPEFKDKKRDKIFEFRLNERLKHISFAENQSDWPNLQNTYSAILNEFNFYQVNRISFAFTDIQPPIENTEKNFYQDDKNNIYYVGGWDRPRAVEVFSFIFELLALEKVSIKLLQDLLLISEPEIIDYLLEKNLSVPESWLKHIRPISPGMAVSGLNSFNEPIPLTNVANSNITDSSVNSEISKLAISSGLSAPERTKSNKEAKVIALNWLKIQNFDCGSIIEDYDKILNAEGADGIICTVIVKSMSEGNLYIQPINWLELDKENTFLLTVDKGKVTNKINSTEELLSMYAKTIMRVDNDQDVGEEITQIAQITSHVATTQFVFFDVESKFNEIFEVYSNMHNMENKEIVFNTELNDDLDD